MELSEILDLIGDGDEAASDQLLEVVYDDLRRLADSMLKRERPGQTIQATGLVHEVYLKLVNASEDKTWDHRGHFFAAAAEAMRRILVDRARHKKSLKRGGDRDRTELHEAELSLNIPFDDLIDLDESLKVLETRDPLAAKIVNLRFFAGLSEKEVASVLNVSRTTVSVHWSFARVWLYKRLAPKEQLD